MLKRFDRRAFVLGRAPRMQFPEYRRAATMCELLFAPYRPLDSSVVADSHHAVHFSGLKSGPGAAKGPSFHDNSASRPLKWLNQARCRPTDATTRRSVARASLCCDQMVHALLFCDTMQHPAGDRAGQFSCSFLPSATDASAPDPDIGSSVNLGSFRRISGSRIRSWLNEGPGLPGSFVQASLRLPRRCPGQTTRSASP